MNSTLPHAIPSPAWLSEHRLEKYPSAAIDGGIHFLPHPELWIGDGDSGTPPQGIPTRLKPQQNETDFRFALNTLHEGAWTQMHLFGFLGGRRDHELALWGEVQAEMQSRSKFERATFYNDTLHPQVMVLRAGTHEIAHRGPFSVLTLAPASLTLKGDCRYPARELRVQTLSGQGISNEAFGTVHMACSTPLLWIQSESTIQS